eukprot:TRINITY_DN598_c0_g1_i1.p1 TRINITY_DN598_c0_g1~~TRINITY_DN598_c0_g1_i1.p1  ORF type:complete len:499 (+),score=99.49 TRINITY_DN598_c0_g1_i1:236-1732(+)
MTSRIVILVLSLVVVVSRVAAQPAANSSAPVQSTDKNETEAAAPGNSTEVSTPKEASTPVEDTPKEASTPQEASPKEDSTSDKAPDSPKEDSKPDSTPDTPADKNDTSSEEDKADASAKDTNQTSDSDYVGDYDYDFFDFDGIFSDDYDYDENYFDFYNDYGYDSDSDSEDYLDFYGDIYNPMYQGLYEDYYEEYYYEDDDYVNYEYYGDYGYYGVYDENGDFYDFAMDDEYGDYDYLYDYFDSLEDKCQFDTEKNALIFNASMDICNITVQGADAFLKDFKGGIDGVYKLAGCYNDRPKYVRDEHQGQERVLWFHDVYQDWNINPGKEPSEMEIIINGGQGLSEERPNFVGEKGWLIAEKLVTDKKGEVSKEDQEELEQQAFFYDYYDEVKLDFMNIDLKVTCDDGRELNRPERSQMSQQPLLTDEEMEWQYRGIYEKYSRKQRPQQINFALVVVVVFAGMGVVFGIPFLMARKVSKTGKTYWKMYQEAQKQRINKL